ncbi:MAG TPA: hypothetical protein VFW73_09930, partial [Lacipirellulaceae bacterium]|nr:hypothetical protein [Lacipirellulaceae bacterium]
MNQREMRDPSLLIDGQLARFDNGQRLRREVWPVPPVPFTLNNRIDEYALDELTDFYVQSGVKGI